MIDQPHYLWLMLSGEAHDRFRALIAALSARYGTFAFEPHITLLGGLVESGERLAERTRALALTLAPLELTLGDIKCLDEYYRCLFIEVGLSNALHHAHEAAVWHFDSSPGAPFYPHLSLVYGNLPRTHKEEIINTIGRRFDETVRVEQLALYAVENRPPTWRCIERAALGDGGG